MPLFLALLYLGTLSLQTRTKLRESLKGILHCCKLQIVFKSQNKLANTFHFKDCIPKELTSGVIYKLQCGFCNESYHGECVRHLNVRIGVYARVDYGLYVRVNVRVVVSLHTVFLLLFKSKYSQDYDIKFTRK